MNKEEQQLIDDCVHRIASGMATNNDVKQLLYLCIKYVINSQELEIKLKGNVLTFNQGIDIAADICDQAWNDSHTMVNQKAQVIRLRDLILEKKIN